MGSPSVGVRVESGRVQVGEARRRAAEVTPLKPKGDLKPEKLRIIGV